ncbi:MAG: EscU/YscU/HrcU family type III secretion system export apparatus switch protein [Pseudomonadota bacterium]
MSGQPSEEKSYDASPQKLRKAREKGQLWQSRDVVTTLATIAAVGYLWMVIDGAGDALTGVFDAAFRSLDLSFDQALPSVVSAGWDAVLDIVLPMIGMVVAIVVIAKVAISGGLVFATEPIVPKFDKIDPVSGFKRLFGAQGFVNFFLSGLKLIALVLALAIVLPFALEPMILSAGAGLDGTLSTFDAVLTRLIVVMMAIMIVIAIADLLIQRHMFLREMMMTRTEMKQEHKDQDGDPQIRSRRRQLARRALEKPSGLRLATFIITDGSDLAIALRYVDGETAVPIVVARAKGDSVRTLLTRAPDEAKQFDHPIAGRLTKVEPGDYVPPDQVAELAKCMRSAGVV